MATTANWVDIDTDSLAPEAKAKYDAYKVAQREAAKLRETFEQHVVGALDIPEGKRMVFGYRFGKLSAAVVEDERKPAKAKQVKATLGDFLAAQASSGRRA